MIKLTTGDIQAYIDNDGDVLCRWSDDRLEAVTRIVAEALLQEGLVEPEDYPQVFECDDPDKHPADIMMEDDVTNEVLLSLDDEKLPRVFEVAVEIYKARNAG